MKSSFFHTRKKRISTKKFVPYAPAKSEHHK
nr:MAG TPA: hypothetical protein [Bacteriophage sp.]